MKTFITVSIEDSDKLGMEGNDVTESDKKLMAVMDAATCLIAMGHNLQLKITNLPVRDES